MTRHRSLLVAVIALAAMAVALVPSASASTLYFVGHADDDSDTTIHFTAKGRYKKTSKGKTFVACADQLDPGLRPMVHLLHGERRPVRTLRPAYIWRVFADRPA